MKITFLGTGTSHGVPKIGCSCSVCTSSDSLNKRYRSSVLIQKEGYSVVIDTAVEFRLQVLRAHLNSLDAVFYTHNHADHLNGIDDLRSFSESSPLAIYGPQEVVDEIYFRFPYAVKERGNFSGLPNLRVHTLPLEGIEVGPFSVVPIPLIHGCREVFGYRFGDFAYLTDCKKIPDSSYPLLEGVEVVVLDALREKPHPTHMSIEEAIEAANRIGANRCYLTHLSHRFDHRELEDSLPPTIYVAYDELVLEL